MSLRSAAFSAGRWTTASLLLRAALQFAQTMILARILTPADFGLMAIIMAVYGVVALLIDLGLSNALIHFPDRSRPLLSSLYWLNLGAAVLMMATLMLSAWPLARLYGQSELLPAMLLLSLAMPISASGQQFRVMAEKDLKFSRLAWIEVSAAVGGFIAALLVAMLEGGVYAFIVAILVTSAISSGLAWAVLSKGIRPGLHFNLQEVKPHLSFGSYRLADTLLISAQMQADVLIGGAVTGSAAMGIYTLPRDLTLRLANTVVNPVVTRVGLPIMAKVQADRTALKSIYLQTMRMTSSVNFPIYAALALWADEVVALLLGSQWHDAGKYMQMFALWGLIRSTANPVGSLLNATGKVRRAFVWDLTLLLIIPGVLYLGFRVGGLYGLATAMLAVQLLTFYPHYHFLVKPACGASFVDYLGALTPALASTGIAVVAALLVMMPLDGTAWLRAAVGAVAGVAAYLVASFLFNRPWLQAMLELAQPVLPRRLRRTSAPAAAPAPPDRQA